MGNVSRTISPSEPPANNRKSTSIRPSAPTSDGAASVNKKIKGLGDDWASISADEYHSPEILANKLFPFPKNLNSTIKLPVKLFISSISPSLVNMAKVVNFFKKGSLLFGASHVGLQFGNVIIDWNESSLVHIGELKSKSATVLFDVQDSIQVVYSPELEQKTVAFIQKWNISIKYSQTEWNCHKFVKEFLDEVLSLKLSNCFQGVLGDYIEYVIAKGDPKPRLKSKNHGLVTFDTHQDLERIEREREADKDKPEDQRRWNFTPDELKLMKVFHRGFQMREAVSGNYVHCSYGNPTGALEIL
jgi:hypothetical protein